MLLSYQNVQHANYYWNTEANANHFLVSFFTALLKHNAAFQVFTVSRVQHALFFAAYLVFGAVNDYILIALKTLLCLFILAWNKSRVIVVIK